jgi:hypothetical protein
MKEQKGQNIDSLAEEANRVTTINKYLKKKIDLYTKYINLTKEAMTKYLPDKSNSLIDLFNSYLNEIQKDYDNLQEEYDKKYLPKYQLLYDECLSDITFGKPVLNQYRAEEFVLDYLKDKSDDLINGLKKSIQQTKEFQIFREPKRLSMVDIKKGNKEIEKTTTELQQNLLYECKKCNKFRNKFKKYNNNIKDIQKNIKILKKYKISLSANVFSNNGIQNEEKKIESTPTKISFQVKNPLKGSVNMGFINPSFRNKEKNETEQINSDDEHRGANGEKIKTKKSGGINKKKSSKKIKTIKNGKNKIISEFKKVEDLFNISSEEDENEKIIDDELHSDDEAIFEERIDQPAKLTQTYLENVRQQIPKINLNQIEYNKLKILNEADLYSLQRRKYKAQNIDDNIKEMKKKIEKMNEKVDIIKKKEKIMKDYIDKVKDKLEVLKPMERQNTLCSIKPIMKQSLFGGDNIEDELINEFGSDNDNEQKEDTDKDRELMFNYSNDLKKSVFAGRGGKSLDKNKKKKYKLKQSVQVGIFNNKLTEKRRMRERNESK